MLYYDSIGITEETDPDKSNGSNECMIFHYWFFNSGFKFHDNVWNVSQWLSCFYDC